MIPRLLAWRQSRASRPSRGHLSAAAVAVALLSGTAFVVSSGRAVASEPRLIDGVLAVVGARFAGPAVRLILRSDVELRARLLLLAEGDPQAFERELPEALLMATLDQLLGEALIAAESERLSMGRPSAADIRAEWQRLADAVGGPGALNEALERLGATAEELHATSELRATVAGFLAANLERTVVTDAEVEAARDNPDNPYRTAGLPDARERVRAWLIRVRTEAAVRSWVTGLRQRIPHRVVSEL